MVPTSDGDGSTSPCERLGFHISRTPLYLSAQENLDSKPDYSQKKLSMSTYRPNIDFVQYEIPKTYYSHVPHTSKFTLNKVRKGIAHPLRIACFDYQPHLVEEHKSHA